MKTTLFLAVCTLAAALSAGAAPSAEDGNRRASQPASAALQSAGGDAEIRDAYHKSLRYEKAQNYSEAIRALAPVVSAFPQGYTVHLRLGWLNYLQGALPKACEEYEAAMKIAPESLEARLGYLLPLLAQERYSEAESVARHVVRVDPANYYGNLRLAYALRLQKKFDAADELLTRQLSLYPSNVGLLTEWGLIRTAKKLPAERIFNDVLTLDPDNVVAKAQLSRTSPANASGSQVSEIRRP